MQRRERSWARRLVALAIAGGVVGAALGVLASNLAVPGYDASAFLLITPSGDSPGPDERDPVCPGDQPRSAGRHSCPGARTSLDATGLPFAHLYPGDDVVDIIGLGFYDYYWDHPNASPEARWQWLRDVDNGLTDHRDFAAEQNKPILPGIRALGAGNACRRRR